VFQVKLTVYEEEMQGSGIQ